MTQWGIFVATVYGVCDIHGKSQGDVVGDVNNAVLDQFNDLKNIKLAK